MIPRKRLQVLLYTLQIFYVLGDVANPGRENSFVNELGDNIVVQHNDDSSAFTVKPADEDSSIQTLSTEKEESSKTSPFHDQNYSSKEDDKTHVSQDNIPNDLGPELIGEIFNLHIIS